MGQEFFVQYQKGEDAKAAFAKAKTNALTYHGNYLENGSISTVKSFEILDDRVVPKSYRPRLESLLRSDPSLGAIKWERCLALAVAEDEGFSWRNFSLLLAIERNYPELQDEDIYQAIEEHSYVGQKEMVTHLEVNILREDCYLQKEQAALATEDVYLVSDGSRLETGKTFLLAAEAEDEAIRLSEENGGSYSVFALKRSSTGDPLFRSTFQKKRSDVETNFRLATAKDVKPSGWYFFGIGAS